eukprot:6120084-Amphidinium_carterae.1
MNSESKLRNSCLACYNAKEFRLALNPLPKAQIQRIEALKEPTCPTPMTIRSMNNITDRFQWLGRLHIKRGSNTALMPKRNAKESRTSESV